MTPLLFLQHSWSLWGLSYGGRLGCSCANWWTSSDVLWRSWLRCASGASRAHAHAFQLPKLVHTECLLVRIATWCALMAKAMDAAKISAMEGRQVSVEALDEA